MLYGRRAKTSTRRFVENGDRVSATSPFAIDLVYTWVDDSDVDWQNKKSHYWQPRTDHFTDTASHPSRYHNRDELRFSLRSVAEYAPFINKIYIVTDNQVPSWLTASHPGLVIVPHDQILPSDALPTFNSHAIEARLHHIPGLSEHYIYMNDDFFFGRPASPFDYFTSDGLSIDYLLSQTVSETEPRTTDTGLVVSMKNSRRLIHDTFGITIRNKLAHSPHAQIRSVLFELERLYDTSISGVVYSKFKHLTGISLPSALYPYYALGSNQGVLKPLSGGFYHHKYINTASPFLEPVLEYIYLTKKYHTFCINEPISDIDASQFDHIVTHFLQRYFPDKSAFER